MSSSPSNHAEQEGLAHSPHSSLDVFIYDRPTISSTQIDSPPASDAAADYATSEPPAATMSHTTPSAGPELIDGGDEPPHLIGMTEAILDTAEGSERQKNHDDGDTATYTVAGAGLTEDNAGPDPPAAMLAKSLEDSDIPKKNFALSNQRQATAGTCLEHIDDDDGSAPAPLYSAELEDEEDVKKKQAIRSEVDLKLQVSTTDLRIQVCSDLHTEFYGRFERIPEDIIVPKAPVLALIGDIGLAVTESLRRFLHFQAGRFEHVLFVAGNHEYYNDRRTRFTVHEQFHWLKKVCSQKDNLHFLERTAVEINGVIILGTTLWSKIPKQSMERAQMSMNDYHKSYIAIDKTMTVNCTNHQFHTSLKWLEDQIQKYSTQNKSIIILTHHTPLVQGTSNPIYHGSELNCCFSTNLSKLLQSPIKYWACGHTHWNFDLTFDNGNTRLVSNQRGYPGRGHSGYDNEGLILRIPETPVDNPDGDSWI